MTRFPWFTVCIALIAAAVSLQPGLTAAAELDRAAFFTHGQVWRLWTGHLTHFGSAHLGWDLAVWLALGSWAECTDRRLLLRSLLVGAPLIGLGVLVWQPQFTVYRGLSGLDSLLYGLVVGGIATRAWQQRDQFSAIVAVLAGLGFVAKTLHEFRAGTAVFVASADFTPVPLAHAIGAAIGLGGAWLSRLAPPAWTDPRAQSRLLASRR